MCPVGSQCIATVGRIWPKVDEQPPAITNETSEIFRIISIFPRKYFHAYCSGKETAEKEMAKFEGKNFVKRDCIARNKLNQEGCTSFLSKSVAEKLGFGKCF